MSVSQINQNQAELLYIDDMLTDVNPQKLSPGDEAVLPDNKVEAPIVAVDENLYQIVSIAGVKFAARKMDIQQHVKCNDTVITDDSIVHDGNSYLIIDVAKLLNAESTNSEDSVYLLIDGVGIAVPCEEVLTIEKISKNEVCWRNENSKRKWLAGTCKNLGVAILDVTMLQQTQ